MEVEVLREPIASGIESQLSWLLPKVDSYDGACRKFTETLSRFFTALRRKLPESKTSWLTWAARSRIMGPESFPNRRYGKQSLTWAAALLSELEFFAKFIRGGNVRRKESAADHRSPAHHASTRRSPTHLVSPGTVHRLCHPHMLIHVQSRHMGYQRQGEVKASGMKSASFVDARAI